MILGSALLVSNDAVTKWLTQDYPVSQVWGLRTLFVLIPIAERHLSNEEHDRLKASLIPRWSRFVHSCIALFLISGFYNFFLRLGAVTEGAYHMLFGIKFLLSFGVMFLAFVLTSQRSWASSFRVQSSKWLTILLSMAAVIVLLAGVMKTM